VVFLAGPDNAGSPFTKTEIVESGTGDVSASKERVVGGNLQTELLKGGAHASQEENSGLCGQRPGKKKDSSSEIANQGKGKAHPSTRKERNL